MTQDRTQADHASGLSTDAPRAPSTVELFGVPMANATLSEFLDYADARIAQRIPGYVVTPNVDHICRLQRDAAFREAYREAFIALPDGVPVLWFAKFLGTPLRAKLSGSDLVPLLCERAAQKGHRVYFFGAAPGVADEAAERLRERYPGLIVAGTYSPPLGFEKDLALSAEIAQRVKEARPDICFVALGAPKQEFWMQRWYAEVGVSLALGIGGSLDFEAGRTRRAPRWIQRVGLEWFWRLCQEPRRLWKRYLVEDAYFVALMWREFWSRRRRGVR